MKRKVKLIRTTLLGGVLFLLPVVIVVMVVTRGFLMTSKMAAPLAKYIPINAIGGVGTVTAIAVLLLLLICFIAGLLARRAIGRTFAERIESKLHDFYPRYTVIKGITQELGGDDERNLLTPVMAHFDDSVQVGFEIERGKNGLVTLFMPGSPDPWSGSVIHMPPHRVKVLDTDFRTVSRNLKRLGSGMADVLDASGVPGTVASASTEDEESEPE